MNLFHAHFALHNLQAFERLFEQRAHHNRTQPSTGNVDCAPTSTSSSGIRASATPTTTLGVYDVNEPDRFGRTVLHLACSTTDQLALEFVRLLLAAKLNVNLQDTENGWTALHRALYSGNILAAVLLLQRADLDPSVKDHEGYTAFDLYNSTLHGTIPSPWERSPGELLTWNTNRNAVISPGDPHDTAFPDSVFVGGKSNNESSTPDSTRSTIDGRFLSVGVEDVAMSRSQMVIITSESSGNIRVSGMGGGGRPASTQNVEPMSTTLPNFTFTVTSIAVGHEHVLALTASGEVLSWGMNRYSQLGYVLENPSKGGENKREAHGRQTHGIVGIPRRVAGPLRGSLASGVAVCKTASACWTEEGVFTWGTNHGQLGYDKSMQPVQVLPHRVTKVPFHPHYVTDVAITEHAMVWLLDTKEVWVITNDRGSKINFPTHISPLLRFFSPPRTDADIAKIASAETESMSRFAAVGTNGDVWTWTYGTTPSGEGAEVVGGGSGGTKVQRLWALRKQGIITRGVALAGVDGSMLVCTHTGRVMMRTCSATAGKQNGSTAATAKFQQVPNLQRVVRVCANSVGTFAVVRLDRRPKEFAVESSGMAQEIWGVRPWAKEPIQVQASRFNATAQADSVLVAEEDEGPEDASIERDIEDLRSLLQLLSFDKHTRREREGLGIFDRTPLAHGADLVVQVVSGFAFPAHRLVLAARCVPLCGALAGSAASWNSGANLGIAVRLTQPKRTPVPRLMFSGCHAITALILVNYLYSDELLAIWDRRVADALGSKLKETKVDAAQVKTELQVLAHVLELPFLAHALESPAKRVPAPSLLRDMSRLFDGAQINRDHPGFASTKPRSPLLPDVILAFSDKEVLCHSVILRARSQFFACFFDDPDWTVNRWAPDGTVKVDLKHLDWRIMDYVLRFMCRGADDIFQNLDFVSSADELLEFMFEILAAANELLIERLVLLCSAVILRHANIYNACYIFAHAVYYHTLPLIESIQDYMAVNMETLLETRMLDDLSPDLVEQLGTFVRREQAAKNPVTRTERSVNEAMSRHSEWLALQDFAQPLTVGGRRRPVAARASPTSSHRGSGGAVTKGSTGANLVADTLNIPSASSVTTSARIRPTTSCDDIFDMDDIGVTVAAATNTHQSLLTVSHEESSQGAPVWRGVHAAPRVDMRVVMAEAESSRLSARKRTPSPRRLAGSGDALGEQAQMGSPFARASPGERLPVRIHQSQASAPIATTSAQSPSIVAPAAGSLPRQKRESIESWRTPRLSSVGPGASSPSSIATGVQSTPPRGPTMRPGFGPTFSPSKQVPSPSIHIPTTGLGVGVAPAIRRVSSGGRAWTLPPAGPVVEESCPPLVSFVAIQQLQQDQSEAGGNDLRRSFKEIQEEERVKRVEEEFLKWWSEEEMRVRTEVGATTAAASGGSSGLRRERKARAQRDKRPGGGKSSENRNRT